MANLGDCDQFVTNRPLQPLTEPHRSKIVRMAKANIHAVFFDVEKIGSNPPPATNLFNHLHRLVKIAKERIFVPLF